MSVVSTHRAGELASYDSLRALVPCKVLRVYRNPETRSVRADLGVTADRPGYRRGEVLSDVPVTHVWPRSLVRHRKYSTVLVGPYAWLPEGETT